MKYTIARLNQLASMIGSSDYKDVLIKAMHQGCIMKVFKAMSKKDVLNVLDDCVQNLIIDDEQNMHDLYKAAFLHLKEKIK